MDVKAGEKMEIPILTIAIPTFNRLEKLKKCLQRVLEEISNKQVELLVSDNASIDGTQEFMHSMCEIYPTISYYRNNSNVGADRNFLNCFNKATGEYILILSDDDILLPGAVNSILEVLFNKPIFVHLNSCGLMNDNPLMYGTPKFKEEGARVYYDKNDILNDIGIYITFVSSLILKMDLVRNVRDKEQYIGTYFLQSHVALRTMQIEGTYVINTYNCLAASPNRTVNYDLYYVWFECFYKLLMETAVSCGFDKKRLFEIYYKDTCNTVLDFVLHFRRTCRNNERLWNKSSVFKCLKDHRTLIIVFKIVIYCPTFLLPIINKVIRFIRRLRQ